MHDAVAADPRADLTFSPFRFTVLFDQSRATVFVRQLLSPEHSTDGTMTVAHSNNTVSVRRDIRKRADRREGSAVS